MLKKQLLLSIALFFSIACAQNAHYTALLNDSLWFYEVQRSGKLPSDNRVPWYVDLNQDNGWIMSSCRILTYIFLDMIHKGDMILRSMTVKIMMLI